ncbi:S1C family serine protease [Desertibaculum subflavum]|uniref:S1C family serine protease n=1 Tax=Desertibaculum subflavum TaxID=2268458 RepID=UPI0034D15A47
MRSGLRLLLAGAFAAFAAGAAPAQQRAAPPMPAGPLSSTAERIYATARPQLLQVRTLVAAAGRQSSIGSGFLVGDDGLAVTNYHVVSQYALDPATYRLEYTAADGASGELTLLAMDIANDLAVVRLDGAARPYFRFGARAAQGELPQGERLFSMGNPLDLGFTIVEGTYNARVQRSYTERILFSGAINPGMSGGPAVTADGHVAGINVAKRTDGELVSFLVPSRFAEALVTRARAGGVPAPKELRAEIARQLKDWQAALYADFNGRGFRAARLGPYEVPESAAPWFTCWARTNAEEATRQRAQANSTSCSSDTRVFVASGLNVGLILLSHSYVKSVDLNAFQFAAYLTQRSQPTSGGWSSRWYTPQQCHEDFVAPSDPSAQPALQVVWCARAYRKFDDVYDVGITVVTQDRSREALVSRLNLQGVSFENALATTRRFLDAIRWAK